MEARVIVVIACGFESKNKLCKTTEKRLENALAHWELLKKWGLSSMFCVTGNVPYEPGSATLASLMGDYLISRGVPPHQIYPVQPVDVDWQSSNYPGEGVGTCSEARSTTQFFKRSPTSSIRYKLDIFTSDWYALGGKKIWERYAGSLVTLHFFEDSKVKAGWRTRFTYFCYGLVARTALTLGLMPKFASLMNKLQSKRKINGYRSTGCS